MTRKDYMAMLVTKVEKTKGKSGKTYYQIEFNDGKKVNEFSITNAELAYGALRQDMDVRATFTQNGEYTNLQSLDSDATPDPDIPEKAPYVPKSGGFGGGKADPNKLSSIEKQSSMKQAVELVCAGKVEIDQLIPSAEKIYNWIHS